MSLPVKILPQGSMIAKRTRTSEFIRSPPKVRPPLLFTDMFTTMSEFEIAGKSGATVKSSPIKPDLRPFKSTYYNFVNSYYNHCGRDFDMLKEKRNIKTTG